MFFKAVFKPKTSDGAIALDNLLRAKLKKPMNYRLGHAFRVTIDVPDQGDVNKTRDECFKTAEWAQHNNGFADDIFYSVIGYDDELRIIFDSSCPTCKAASKKKTEPKTPHHEHDKGEGDEE